jgi:hypothetical protein
MKGKLAAVVALVVACLAAGPAFAHHGDAAYDMSKMVELKKSTITKWVWANPHCILMFDVTDDSGKVTHWVGETGSPAAVGPMGWSSDFVKPGDVVTVYVWKSKVGTPVGIVNRIVRSDGKEFVDVLGATKEQRDEALRKGLAPSGK